MAGTSTASVRQNKITCTVTYLGTKLDMGIFDTWEGANITADNTKHRRGGMGPQVAIGGPVTIEDLTVSRDYDLARDNKNAHWLSDGVGKAQITARKVYWASTGIGMATRLSSRAS